MWQKLFSGSEWLDLPLVTLVFFMATFVGACVWALARRRSGHYDRMARMPLQED